MFRTMLLASTLALGMTGAALAQGGPRLVGGGENVQVVYDEPSQNVVGGGVASISGGAENTQIAYGRTVITEAPTGLVAELIGGGDNEQVVYHAAPQASQLAGRPARTGG